MTNFEYYKDTIIEITNKRSMVAVVHNEPVLCKEIESCTECQLNNGDCHLNLIEWFCEEHKEQPKLTKKERQFCELVETGWIARDVDDRLYHHKHLPHKSKNLWCHENYPRYNMNYYFLKFPFITWEDEEPWSIEDLLKLEVEETEC